MSISFLSKAEVTSSHIKNVLQRPLIVGASVSADFLTPSPGKRLALRYTAKENIKVVAKNGKPAREVLKAVTSTTLEDRTAIIGIDLFFWDSFGGSIEESFKELAKLKDLSEKMNLPLIVGEVPELSPQFQPHAGKLNAKIRELCRAENHCKVLPLNSLLRKVFMEGSIVQNGQKYTLQSLLPDGLHISAPASEYLSERIFELF